MKTNSGNDNQARMMGGNGVGIAVSASSPTATGFTSGTTLVANAYVGQMVVLGSVYGVVVSNTTTAVTVDRWYTPSSPGGAAASTPAAGTAVIVPGNAPAMFIAISTNSTAPASGDTALAGEITTTGGGLVRQLGVYAHTTGVAGYTLTGTFTANGSDSFPAAVAKCAVFNTMVVGAGGLTFETLLSSTATFNASGDQLTLTSSVTN